MSDSRTTSENAAADLTRLQQELLRTRIDRARRMTEEQRLAEAFALTDSALVLMHEGVMAEMAAADPTRWLIVDGTPPKDELAATILTQVCERLKITLS